MFYFGAVLEYLLNDQHIKAGTFLWTNALLFRHF